MKKLFWILLTIYILCSIGLFIIQDRVIFAAHPYANDFKYKEGTEHEIPLTDELEMNAVLVSENPGQRSKKAILYLHGNKGNARRGIYQARVMKSLGYDIMVIDYRGYGKTEGTPINDSQMLTDVDKAYKYLTQFYEEKNIVVLGYSLGSGMASYIASKNKPAHLVLVAPFTSLTDIKNQWLWMFPDFLLKFNLDNKKHLQDVTCGVSIIHGTEDNVVDYKYAEELKATYPQIELTTCEGLGHRRIIFDNRLRQILEKVAIAN